MRNLPIVLIEINRDSRLRVLRHPGVMVALLDLRIDPQVVILPEVEMGHAALEIDAALQRGNFRQHPIVSLQADDAAHSAADAADRLRDGDIVVAGFSHG